VTAGPSRAGRVLAGCLTRAAALAAALAATLAGSVVVPPSASAEPALARQDVFTISGHGWGHGRGMSQQGAHGAARQGLTAAQIVAFYYPGTTLATGADEQVRVLLSGDAGLTQAPSTSLDVSPAPGLTATDLSTGTALVLPTGPDRWRVVRDSAGLLSLQARTAGTWAAGTTTRGPLQLSSTAPVLRRWYAEDRSRDYRGTLRAIATATGLAVVDHLPMEQYLRAVVPAEVPASWAAEALKAQAVAARSYSSYLRADARRRLPAQPWDLCDSTRCQVYGGATSEAATTDAAVMATARRLLTYGGAPVFAEFSASNGGWTVAGGPAYQVAKPDPYDGLTASSSHAWSAQLRAADLEQRFATLGRLTRLQTTSRDGNGDWGGRVLGVVLEGVDSAGRPTAVTTTGREIALAAGWPVRSDGLRSSWWTITSTAVPSPVAPDPIGRLDLVTTGAGGERARGWAIDPDTSDPVAVRLEVDGRAVMTATAAADRPDVAVAFPRAGARHGFDVALTLAPGAHQVCALALNAAGTAGSDRLLGCRSVTVRHAPFGTFDAWTAVAGGVAVRGWAIDPDTPASITVLAYVDGRAVTGIVAAQRRDDVARAYPQMGAAHGYSLKVAATAGRHALCIYGVNAGGTLGQNVLLGCRTVTA